MKGSSGKSARPKGVALIGKKPLQVFFSFYIATFNNNKLTYVESSSSLGASGPHDNSLRKLRFRETE